MTATPTATKHAWKDVPLEEVNATLSRKLLWIKEMMIGQIFLKDGSLVPAHSHENEQITYILKGCLRFWIGEHADNPGDTWTEVHEGEVLLIPSNVRHRALAIGDTLDLDIFSPPRADWLNKTDDYLRGSK